MSAHRAQIHSHRDKKTRRPINALPDGCKTACHQTKCSWTNVQSEGLQSFSLPLSYRFFLVSFFFLHVWAALLEERAVAWPVVFRWSKSLFLVANSYWQITQRRLTSFYKEQKKKKTLRKSCIKLFYHKLLTDISESNNELQARAAQFEVKQNKTE